MDSEYILIRWEILQRLVSSFQNSSKKGKTKLKLAFLELSE